MFTLNPNPPGAVAPIPMPPPEVVAEYGRATLYQLATGAYWLEVGDTLRLATFDRTEATKEFWRVCGFD